MSEFSQEDVKALEHGGNTEFNSKYMARYNQAKDLPLPSTLTDINKLRDFIKFKYVDKKWHIDNEQKTLSKQQSFRVI